MKKYSILFLLLCFSSSLFAQDLYVPRNIKKAYKKETRSLSGSPGSNYWQNTGIYNIQTKVDAISKVVSGNETIQYSNNSPDTLKVIAIRFVNNLHKPEAPRSGLVSKDFLTTGLEIKSILIDGIKYEVNNEEWGTVKDIKLKTPLLPKSQATLQIEWQYPLSVESGREGQIDSNTFYCAYSYPRVSVYDDYNGWDILPHINRQEFYNDFNDYTFSITAPRNYVVWATGNFLNPEEVLQPEILKRFKQSLMSDQVLHIADAKEMQTGMVTQQKDWNTWKFKADHITDFCFALSNHYVWDAASVPLKTKRVSVQTAYNAGAKDFERYTDWMKYDIDWFYKNWPGIEYPYPVMTAFQGFADMEYPMMVNDGSVPDNLIDSRLTLDHEVAHTYFPFYMGINETRYAFMDEGWASTFEYLIGISEHGEETSKNIYQKYNVKQWINDPSAEEDQPIISMSTQLSGSAYGNNTYGKASLSYLALKNYLGDTLFKKALHHYINDWNGKHPTPWDYFNSMNKGSGKNLNWFWNNWFFSNYYIDLKIAYTKHSGEQLSVNIENPGGFAIPFDAIILYQDGSNTKTHFSPVVWEKNQKKIIIKLQAIKKIKSITLDGGIFMDYNPEDNTKIFK
ncbi:M1 family metallopeptidase [Chryseobacterium herbae]|uniref:M1 family metallopeptidase n=1 Tax=Chryseobacterium herbae TaxID=2976476 RepID=A0ABT2INX7_9FLAO|nr:M1 family metallopeptidase [Chryseobacterium sp. pc1-10]MCT2560519.1 M1 family metallopeptidase [Chryseobacterium sp. pc1-10]